MNKSQAEKRAKSFYTTNVELIRKHGAPWSRLLIQNEAEKRERARDQFIGEILHDVRIVELIEKLSDKILGIPSIASKPADLRVYGSYFWTLRFFADMDLTADEIDMTPLLHQLHLYQLPDGQFTADYRRPKQTPVASVCLTANLLHSLAGLQPVHMPALRAAFNYINTTQRIDGGWHCDLARQCGEKDESAMSCPSANLAVLNAFGEIFRDTDTIFDAAVDQVFDFWHQPSGESYPSCDFNTKQVYFKLRYPPHYRGFDSLNVIRILSLYPGCYHNPIFLSMIEDLLAKWDGKGFLRSEKTIPEWKVFDFARKGSPSCWLSALTCCALKHAYNF